MALPTNHRRRITMAKKMIETQTNGVTNSRARYATDPSEGMMAVPDHIAGQEGEATFATFRQPAWHSLGTVFTTEVTDYETMARLAKIDAVDMHKVEIPVPGVDPADNLHPLFANVGTHPLTGRLTVFGNGGPGYEIRQPKEILSWAQFGPTDGMRWETAGMMQSIVFGTIALETDFVLDPEGVADVTKRYIMASGSYDGSVANRGGVIHVRVECGNTLNAAIKGMTGGYAFKSTKNIRDRVRVWQEVTSRAFADDAIFQAEAEALFATQVTDAVFLDKILPAVKERPAENVKGSQVKWDKWAEANAANWRSPKNAGIRGTAWGAWNALTETAQWDRQIRSGNRENFYRAGAGFDNAANAYRTLTLNVVKALA